MNSMNKIASFTNAYRAKFLLLCTGDDAINIVTFSTGWLAGNHAFRVYSLGLIDGSVLCFKRCMGHVLHVNLSSSLCSWYTLLDLLGFCVYPSLPGDCRNKIF